MAKARTKKSKVTKPKTKGTSRKRRPKRRVGLTDKFTNVSNLVSDVLKDTAKMRRKKRYAGIGEG